MQNEVESQFLGAIEQHQQSILRICGVYATQRAETEDLFQEVVYQVWKSFGSFQKQSNVGTWIYRITLNVCMRAKLSGDKKRLKLVQIESIRFDRMHAASSTDVSGDRFEVLRHCISQLKETDKSIVLLFLEDLAYKEIAEITGLTENHVAVKMKRIKEKLLNCITKNE